MYTFFFLEEEMVGMAAGSVTCFWFLLLCFIIVSHTLDLNTLTLHDDYAVNIYISL